MPDCKVCGAPIARIDDPRDLPGVGFGGGDCIVSLARHWCQQGHHYDDEVAYVEAVVVNRIGEGMHGRRGGQER